MRIVYYNARIKGSSGPEGGVTDKGARAAAEYRQIKEVFADGYLLAAGRGAWVYSTGYPPAGKYSMLTYMDASGRFFVKAPVYRHFLTKLYNYVIHEYMREKEFTKTISADGNDRLRVRIVTKKGAVTDVVVQYEARIKERWRPIVRYDCSHGFFHRDTLNPKGDDEKKVIPINNLNDALTYAEQDIMDRWEWYRERFRRRMK